MGCQIPHASQIYLLGACAVALITGCATAPGTSGLDSAGSKVAGVYRVQEPVGTAAGQYAVGRMDLAEGRVAAAIRRFENALRLDPNYVEALNGLGVAYGQAGRYAEAVESFRSALASGPAAAHVLNNLGYAQMKLGQLDEASVSLARSIELDPVNARTRENLDLLAQAREAALLARAAKPEALRDPAPQQEAQQAAHAPNDNVAAVAAELTMAPSAPTQAASVRATPAEASQAVAPEVEPIIAPTAALPPIDEPLARVEAVHVPTIEVATQVKPADWTARLVSEARSIAATTLEESARTTSYEVVQAKSNDAALVRLAPNLYELRPAVRVAAAAVEPAGTPAPLASIDGLEVSNGVGLPRLASRTARQLSRFGADVARVSDWRNFEQQRTEIHYRSGHLAGAQAVSQRLPVQARLVRASQMHAGVNVRLVLGRDMVVSQVAAWYEEPSGAAHAAAAMPAPVVASALGPTARADSASGWRHL